MKVVAFNGSPRKDGNTTIVLRRLLGQLEQEGIATELVQLSGRDIRGCTGCCQCYDRRDERCVVQDDGANEYIEKIVSAEGLVLGSPAYFLDVPARMKALIERAGFVAKANGGGMYRNKVGAAVAPFRRSGSMHTVDTMMHFFLSSEMVIAGRAIVIGREKGDVERDEEGLQLTTALGQRMAWMLKKLYG